MSTHSNYNKLLEQAREAGTILARTWIPRLCQALKRENPEMPSEDVKETVTKDCADIWSRATIRNNMPGEFKDPQKQEAGKKGREKQLEQLIPAGGAHTTGAEDSSVSETEQGSVDFDSIKRPDVGKATEIIDKMKKDFKNRLEFETNKRDEVIKQKEDEIDKLRATVEVEDILYTIVDDKIGAPKVLSLQRIKEDEKRGYQALTRRFGELVRRRLVEKGEATIKFYIISKDRTTNIEYMVPVNFTVDMLNRSTDMILDESRL